MADDPTLFLSQTGYRRVTATAAPASSLTGSTLASNVVNSSLTSLGTIATGVWQGTIVGVAYGGTGANLSGTGGPSQVLKQGAAGAAITVGQLAASDLSNGITGSNEVVLKTAPTLAGAAVIGANTSSANSLTVNTNVNGGITLTSSNALGPNFKLNQTSQTNYEFYNNGGYFGIYNGSLGLTIFALSGSTTTARLGVVSACRIGWANSASQGRDPLDTHMDRAAAGVINFGNGTLGNSTAELRAGNIKAYQAGSGFYVKEGTNATMGTATLVAGTVTVNTTKVTANSRIFITVQAPGGTQGHLSYSKTAGTSFTINSTSATETSTVNWIIIEPA